MQYLVQPLPPHAARAPIYPGNTDRLYALSAAPSGLALGASGSKAQVRQQVWTGAKPQRWRVHPNGDGSFGVQNVDNEEYLDVKGGSGSNGAVVQTFPKNDTDAQKWRFIEVQNGHYKLENVGSGKVLDLDAGAKTSGDAQIQQWTWYDNDNQRWILCELREDVVSALGTVTVFAAPGFGGASQSLSIGSYAGVRLPLGAAGVASLRVPLGMRVTAFRQANFRGENREFNQDQADIGFVPASLVVERVATFYPEANFGGAAVSLGVGRYDMGKGLLPNDVFSSVRVPEGLQVEVYEHYGFAGDFRTYTGDQSQLYALNDKISSIVIKEPGVIIPEQAVHFGASIALRSVYGKHLSLGGAPKASAAEAGAGETLKVVRLGTSTHRDLVSFGDVIGLEALGYGLAVKSSPTRVRVSDGRSSDEKGQESFVIFRAGPSATNTFLAVGDTIALRPASKQSFLKVDPTGKLGLASGKGPIRVECMFVVVEAGVESEAGACGAAVCAAATCAADFCGAAACGAATSIVGVCGVAARGVAICGVDLGGAGFCGAAACGAAVVGFAACGADACNAAACGAAACGAAACGAAACGAAACGAEACGADACAAAAMSVGVCGADACGAEAGGIDACGADACGANVCGLNLCAADACAADACAIDLIPIIPGI